MTYKPVNLKDKFEKFTQHWSPRVVAELNDYQLKLVKIQGEFVWHSHTDTDEAFLVIEGDMSIEFKDQTLELSTGEMFVVPKGVEHRPYAKNECKIMLIEPRGVINTSDAGGKLRAENDVWV